MSSAPKPVFGQVPPSHAPRDTSPGHQSMQTLMREALERSNYIFSEDAPVTQIARMAYRADFLVFLGRARGSGYLLMLPVKMVWQEASGSAEQKVPFHLLHLAKAAQEMYPRALLVLGGDGWTRKEQYINGYYHPFVSGSERVTVMDFETFILRCGEKKL